MSAGRWFMAAVLLYGAGGVRAADPPAANHARAEAERQVRDAESGFARSMAERDFAAFKGYLSAEAVFFGEAGPARGAKAIAARWEAYFEAPEAPFSWRPETVEVLPSGHLALSTGPVFDPDGRQSAVFTSIWRLEPDGVWRIVFDKGHRFCAEPSSP